MAGNDVFLWPVPSDADTDDVRLRDPTASDGASVPQMGWAPSFDGPQIRRFVRAFEAYTPFGDGAVVATPFTPVQFDEPLSRKAFRSPEWPFLALPAPQVFGSFDAPVPRRQTVKAFDACAPFVPVVQFTGFTLVPFEVPPIRRRSPVVDAYVPFVAVVAPTPFTAVGFDAPRRRVFVRPPEWTFTRVATPFVAPPFDNRPQTKRDSRRGFEAYVPFVAPVVQVVFIGAQFDQPIPYSSRWTMFAEGMAALEVEPTVTRKVKSRFRARQRATASASSIPRPTRII